MWCFQNTSRGQGNTTADVAARKRRHVHLQEVSEGFLKNLIGGVLPKSGSGKGRRSSDEDHHAEVHVSERKATKLLQLAIKEHYR